LPGLPTLVRLEVEMRRTVMIGLVGLFSTAGLCAQTLDLRAYRIVDLTHAFDEQTVYWPTSPSKFELKPLAFGKTAGGYFYSSFVFCTPEHGGTHLDAPMHFAEGHPSIGEVPLDRLMGIAVVIDVSKQAAGDPVYRLTPDDIAAFEKAQGRIPEGAIVLLRTDWSRFWPNVKQYLGDDTPGDASKLKFPGYGVEAARLLVEERKVAVLGIDTASIDYGPSTDFMAHRIGAARNIANLENLTGLAELPPTGATIIALPMKIAKGSGGPVRVIALLPK
jgi:kynurenine formamidase